MSEIRVLPLKDLPLGTKKLVVAGKTEILLIHSEAGICAVQAKCPRAGAPLEEGAVCNGRIICPWHMGTFSLPTGELLEPPAMDPLQTFLVRVNGTDILVDPEPAQRQAEKIEKPEPSPIFLLVGCGAAGVMAAVTLREKGFRGKLLMVDPEPDEPVDRTQLSKDVLSGNLPLEDVKISIPAELFVERVNSSVVKFSASEKQAHLSNGAVIHFDKVLVATGGKPRRLDIPGAELAFTIRHSADVQQISDRLEGGKNVVIIGASFIGLEAASALIQKGLDVTVVGNETLPFEKQFGKDAAQVLKKLHENKGTRFRLGIEVLRITEHEVIIQEKEKEITLPCDLALMGVGVSPQLDFEHDLPLAQKGGGILTDSSLHVGLSTWVAGDIANVDGRRIEHWRVAQQHGRVAALGMMNQAVKSEGVPFFWTYHFEKTFGYLGHAADWDETFVQGDLEKLEFLCFYLKDDLVTAVLNCGYESEMAALAELFRRPLTLEDARTAFFAVK